MEFLDEYLQTNRNTPCYQCENRHPSCHSTCEEYISWCRKREEAKREKDKNRIIDDYEHEKRIKHSRKSK